MSKFIRTFCSKRNGHISASLSSTEVDLLLSCNPKQQNTRKAFFSGPIRILTSTQLRYFGMTSRKWFTPKIPIILLNWSIFLSGMQKNLWLLHRSVLQLQEMFGKGYCCARRALNTRVHILFTLWKFTWCLQLRHGSVSLFVYYLSKKSSLF